jgi:hypothetical protein
MEIVEKYSDKPWNWCNLSSNNFTKQNELIKIQCIKEWLSAKKIQKWWNQKIYYNPFHRVGQKMLEREYNSI